MRNPRKHLLLLAPILVGGLVLVFLRSREPRYAGKSWSQWVEAYYLMTERRDIPAPNRDPAEAIGHFGTNAIPYLLKWIRYERPPWKEKLDEALNSIIQRVRLSLALTDQKELSDLRADSAKEAFSVLGPKAKGVIGELGRLANDPNVSRATA